MMKKVNIALNNRDIASLKEFKGKKVLALEAPFLNSEAYIGKCRFIMNDGGISVDTTEKVVALEENGVYEEFLKMSINPDSNAMCSDFTDARVLKTSLEIEVESVRILNFQVFALKQKQKITEFMYTHAIEISSKSRSLIIGVGATIGRVMFLYYDKKIETLIDCEIEKWASVESSETCISEDNLIYKIKDSILDVF